MSRDQLLFSLIALLFFGVAIFGVWAGRFKTSEFRLERYLRRKGQPALYWLYTFALLAGALLMAYIAIFIAS